MKRQLRCKLNSRKGFTLVEMLCCCLILVILSLIVSVGLGMAGRLYGRMVSENEAEILLSSLSSVLSDELRYAVKANVAESSSVTLSVTDGDAAKLVFESDTYWNNGRMTAMYIGKDGDSKGQLVVKEAEVNDTGSLTGALIGSEYRVLPKSDYGKSTINGATYEIKSIEITKSGDVFTYTITVTRGTGASATVKSLEGTVKNMPHQP